MSEGSFGKRAGHRDIKAMSRNTYAELRSTHIKALWYIVSLWPTVAFLWAVETTTNWFYSFDPDNTPLGLIKSLVSAKTMVAIICMTAVSSCLALSMSMFEHKIRRGVIRVLVQRLRTFLMPKSRDLFEPILIALGVTMIFLIPFRYQDGTLLLATVKIAGVWLELCLFAFAIELVKSGFQSGESRGIYLFTIIAQLGIAALLAVSVSLNKVP